VPFVLAVCAVWFTPVATSASFEPAPALDADAPVILVLPAEWRSDGEPLTLRARLADATGVSRVRAWVMGEGDREYWSVELDAASGAEWSARLPAWKDRGTTAMFWVEAWDRLGNGPRRSGGPANPFVVRLEEPAASAPAPPATKHGGVAVGLLVAPLGLLWLMYRQDRRQRELNFWRELLAPVADRRGPELLRGIDALCARPHVHPTRGETRLDRAELRHWMDHLREVGELRERPRSQRPGRRWHRPGHQGVVAEIAWLPERRRRLS
jgi:hypothetical protein